jgi:uncharacterized membrane protein YgcG
MRKFLALLIVAIGIGGGLLFTVASKGDWILGAVAVGVGLLFTSPIAAAVAGVGGRSRRGRSGSGWKGASGGFSSGGLFKGDAPIRRWDR